MNYGFDPPKILLYESPLDSYQTLNFPILPRFRRFDTVSKVVVINWNAASRKKITAINYAVFSSYREQKLKLNTFLLLFLLELNFVMSLRVFCMRGFLKNDVVDVHINALVRNEFTSKVDEL